ncbi:hypothetical protein Avbf_17744 [Armadillidium vulgare]|nr:hypothetical protein Avbf_17744 [Armadillidium vulgare]
MAVSDILVLLRNDIEKSIPGTAIDIWALTLCLDQMLELFTSLIMKLQFYSKNSNNERKNYSDIYISRYSFLACSSSSGLIPNFVPQSNLHPVSSRKHEGSIVTALSWSNNGRDLYIGDGNGILSLLHVPPNLVSDI